MIEISIANRGIVAMMQDHLELLSGDDSSTALRFACTVLAIAVTVHAGWTLYGNTLDHHEETQLWRVTKAIITTTKSTSRDCAESDVLRMKWAGYGDFERLKVYYNREIDGWFVGRGWAR
eukprot:scaffold1760_cov181-Chaetoceros_neogracile.AAC.1